MGIRVSAHNSAEPTCALTEPSPEQNELGCVWLQPTANKDRVLKLCFLRKTKCVTPSTPPPPTPPQPRGGSCVLFSQTPPPFAMLSISGGWEFLPWEGTGSLASHSLPYTGCLAQDVLNKWVSWGPSHCRPSSCDQHLWGCLIRTAECHPWLHLFSLCDSGEVTWPFWAFISPSACTWWGW